jgi:hypothetical protein
MLFEAHIEASLDSFLNKIPIKERRRVESIFNSNNVSQILVLEPNLLSNCIADVFRVLPEVYEYYFPKQFHVSTKLPTFKYEDFNFTKKMEQKHFDSEIRKYTQQLNQIPGNSYLIKWAISKLDNLTKNSESKSIINKLKKMLIGKSKSPNIFPQWVLEIGNVFEYKKLNKEMAYTIIDKLDVSVCPYCNEDPLHYKKGIKGEKDYRPAFDHFYPKSKFPFLSLSIYNLVPSCEFCNKDGKGVEDTYHIPHVSPHLKGVSEPPVFTYNTGELFQGIDKLEKKDIEIQINSLSEDYGNNFRLFDLKHRDTRDSLTKEESERVDSFISRNINRGLLPTKTKNKKFSLDLYNQILGNSAKLKD